MSIIYSEKLDRLVDTDLEDLEELEEEMDEEVEEIPQFKGTKEKLNNLLNIK